MRDTQILTETSKASTQSPARAATSGQFRGKPWRDIKGDCGRARIYRSKSRCGNRVRWIYQVPRPGQNPDRFTTTNKTNALNMAAIQANLPADKAPALLELKSSILRDVADAIIILDPILRPFNTPVGAGILEYARLKAKIGKLDLDALFDGLLAACPDAKDVVNLSKLLAEIGGAIDKLVPVLSPLNISVASGIEEYTAVKAQAGVQDLRQLLKDVQEKPWVERSKTAIAVVVNQYLESLKKARRSYEYYKGQYYSLSALVDKVGATAPIGVVGTPDLESLVFLDNREPRSNDSVRCHFLAFFHWCQLQQYLAYSKPTAADRLPKIKVPRKSPKPLKVGEAKAILTAVDDIWCLLYLVLSLFTAIRHDELQCLTFDMIKTDCLDIPAEISKTGKRRIIPLHPALRAWLAPFRGRSGLVIPIASIQLKVRTFLQCCGIAGVPKKWHRNWLRQSYCSYRLAETGDVIETSKEDGHAAYVLERDYLEICSNADARRYFALSPIACGKADWNKRVKALIKDMPEVKARRTNRTKSWKNIGEGPQSTPPAQKSAGRKDSAPQTGGGTAGA